MKKVLYSWDLYFQALESPVLYEMINNVTGETEFLTLEQVTDKLSSLQTVQVV